jgi:hypothetical protein
MSWELRRYAAFWILPKLLIDRPKGAYTVPEILEPAQFADGPSTSGSDPKNPTTSLIRHLSRPLPGRNFLVALRLYGSGVEFNDLTWKPDDVVKVK